MTTLAAEDFRHLYVVLAWEEVARAPVVQDVCLKNIYMPRFVSPAQTNATNNNPPQSQPLCERSIWGPVPVIKHLVDLNNISPK